MQRRCREEAHPIFERENIWLDCIFPRCVQGALAVQLELSSPAGGLPRDFILSHDVISNFMTRGEELSYRLVCKSWNQWLKHANPFNRLLHSAPKPVHEALLEDVSYLLGTNIHCVKLTNISISGGASLPLRLLLSTHMRSLVFTGCNFSSGILKDILSEGCFQAVDQIVLEKSLLSWQDIRCFGMMPRLKAVRMVGLPEASCHLVLSVLAQKSLLRDLCLEEMAVNMEDVGGLKSLRQLQVHDCSLSGTQLPDLPALEHLAMSNNRWSAWTTPVEVLQCASRMTTLAVLELDLDPDNRQTVKALSPPSGTTKRGQRGTRKGPLLGTNDAGLPPLKSLRVLSLSPVSGTLIGLVPLKTMSSLLHLSLYNIQEDLDLTADSMPCGIKCLTLVGASRLQGSRKSSCRGGLKGNPLIILELDLLTRLSELRLADVNVQLKPFHLGTTSPVASLVPQLSVRVFTRQQRGVAACDAMTEGALQLHGGPIRQAG